MLLNSFVFIPIITFAVSAGLFYLFSKYIIISALQKRRKLFTYIIIALTVAIVLFCTFFYTPDFLYNEILIALVGALAGLTIAIVSSGRGNGE